MSTASQADSKSGSQAALPRYILMHANDNVAIVVNDGGLPVGTVFPDGLTLLQAVPQGHKIALRDIAQGAPIIRYDVAIGYAVRDIAKGSWIEESLVTLPPARELDNLPIATRVAAPAAPLDGYTFEGYRNADGSVGTRNLLAITTTVQCVAGVVEHAVKRIREELLPKYPNVEDVVALEHTYGCGVAIDAPNADIPIRTLRNISLNPNFGGQAMGSIVKSGSSPIAGVLSPGDKLKQKGLIYATTPASDFVCGTLQLAAGMNLHIFTTGRGTPYGLAAVPVIKVATRNDLARRWHDLMDVNAGRIASGEATIEDVGWKLFHLMLDVASGRKQTWAEKWKLHNALTLFNPAPIT